MISSFRPPIVGKTSGTLLHRTYPPSIGTRTMNVAVSGSGGLRQRERIGLVDRILTRWHQPTLKELWPGKQRAPLPDAPLKWFLDHPWGHLPSLATRMPGPYSPAP